MSIVALSILCTVCALCTGFAAWACYRAVQAQQSAEYSAKQLMTSRGRLVALESSVDKLDEAVRRAVGRINVARRRDRERDDEVPEEQHALPLANGALDPDLEATLALQRAPSAAPGSQRG